MGTLYEKLKSYSQSDYYGFHMPGHKRSARFAGDVPSCRVDITEIEGFDDLHHPEGVLKEAQKRASELYGADETHFLVNGSTVGILSAILGSTNKGDRVLVARNCHKSVYNAIYMNELEPVYLYPGFDRENQLNTAISPKDVREALGEHPDIRAVVVVSPTYDGVVSDVAAIASAAHEKGVPLIVDEAHGAHFGFHPYFPQNANEKGADLVIHSLHKTLPSLTQTALLHMNGPLADRPRVRNYLHMLQSSSPSYILMAGIDSCVCMLEQKREELFLPYIEKLEETRRAVRGLKAIRLIEAGEYFDRSKLILSARTAGVSGRELYQLLLERYHLQMEMMAGTYVLAMTSVGDSGEGFHRLTRALSQLDEEFAQRLRENPPLAQLSDGMMLTAPLRLPRIYKAADLERLLLPERSTGHQRAEAHSSQTLRKKIIPQAQSAGYVSLEYVYLYPPGIPLIVPGELITEQAACYLTACRRAGCTLEGPARPDYLEVCHYNSLKLSKKHCSKSIKI